MNKNLNVCIVSKFPPIEGGMSAKAFWLATGIANKGVNTTVLTNSNVVENEHAIHQCATKAIKNLKIEQIILSDQFYIPCRDLDIAGFLEKAIRIVRQNNINLIDAHYLIPYGIVAYLINKIFDIPYIIRHGGSDINKFLNKKIFEELLDKVLHGASLVETNDSFVASKSRRTIQLPPYVPNEIFFNAAGRENSCCKKIRIAYIGKINNLWYYKGLDKIAEIFSKQPDKFELIFLAQGLGMDDFKSKIDTRNIDIQDFIPPWEMPSFYKKIDYIVYLLDQNPLPDWPNIVPEALLSGVKIITDNKRFFKKFNMLCKNIEDSIFQLDIHGDHNELYDLLANFMGGRNKVLSMDYDSYIEENIKIYLEVIKESDCKSSVSLNRAPST